SIESRHHEGQQHETCCNAGTLAMCKMPALVGTYVTNTGLMATYGGQFTLTKMHGTKTGLFTS
ncbi:hypothetical protein, partial [Escherichia coli]|uniref:hypothetical protein n=1 Tax=Escherichia coli TaxID=562 RepID=UPI00390C71D6